MSGKKPWRLFQWLFFTALVLMSLISGIRDDIEVRQILDAADLAAAQLELSADQNHEQSGVVDAISGGWRFTTSQLHEKIASLPANRRHQFYTWSGIDQLELTGSASGVDQKAYFANSFLIGFKPFDTKSIWEPLATLSLRKSYVLDHELYGPEMAEIWQNSRQAYAYTRGDCEDHAIILADWLIALGHDARVVLGQFDNGGHAWVVLFIGDREYILEATSKRRPRSLNDFQIAGLATDYRPVYQFDRNRFWVNTGSMFTTRYRDAKWQLRSKFSRQKQAPGPRRDSPT